MKQMVARFFLQPTRGFPDGAPQRETWNTDSAFQRAVLRYQEEWREEYDCNACKGPECPICNPLRELVNGERKR